MSPHTPDPLAALEVVDRLEVGPVRLEPDRLSAPYRVHRGAASDHLELSYRWEEPVFDPTEPASRNLAALIAAQVALNYGLLCREIIFHGPYDERDRRFLAEMAANTAREIYVKKFLEDNPFLTAAARELPAERRESYLRARLRFDPEEPPEETAPWGTSSERHAVLSSGGKDSLLSYGLLRELDQEVHPVFVNESGRHWFTALNAYRHFRQQAPGTARVWTSSDRLFTWMLRHLPFVRPDFQRLRSDEYPIRLWTVAVFLFGALPLLRKRGIGRLVIGDEHDTTVRRSHEGIPHYDGLYDQSRWFDHALTRYFLDKGWSVVQLSLLRPLSELLIETLLARRYPDLLRHQVSCHAAHKEEERVVPCGRCEKCRRIVGMLTAAGADPAACGYRTKEVPGILRSLMEKGVHQERPAVEHLAAVLHDRGAIPAPRLGSVAGRRRPEIACLRFHPQRSPVEEVPQDLRAPLYRVLLQHAEGALSRRGRRWVPFELLADPTLDLPGPFDDRRPAPPERRGPGRPGRGRRSGPYLWGELTWPEAEKVLKHVDIALLPVGSIEQHGPHLPLDTDAFDSDYLARRVAEACGDPKPLVLPLIPYGVAYHHDDFPGTLSIGNETLARLVYEIGMSAATNGIAKLIVINGHGGNNATLNFAAQMINRDAHIFTCVDSGEISDPDVYALAETPNDVHAGEIETSTSLATRPELVKMGKAEAFVPRFSTQYLDFTSKRSIEWYARTAKISESGVFGDPTKASRGKGERMWELMIHHLVELVEHLKGLSLEEIYQRRV